MKAKLGAGNWFGCIGLSIDYWLLYITAEHAEGAEVTPVKCASLSLTCPS